MKHLEQKQLWQKPLYSNSHKVGAEKELAQHTAQTQ
jgi:hypothetical protein